jgi:hypothetical protein
MKMQLMGAAFAKEGTQNAYLEPCFFLPARSSASTDFNSISIHHKFVVVVGSFLRNW